MSRDTVAGEQLQNDAQLTRELIGDEVTNTRLVAIAACTASRGGIKTLVLRGNDSTQVANFSLKAIALCCPCLEVLSLSNISSIGDESLYEISNGCRLLKELELCHMSSISDMSTVTIVAKCPELILISLEDCTNIGDATLQAFALHCPKLESITIKNCPLIGDEGMACLLTPSSLVRPKAMKLEGLKISDYSLASTGHHGKAITDLTLVDINGITNRGFWIMANGQGLYLITSLRSLLVMVCSMTISKPLEWLVVASSISFLPNAPTYPTLA